MRNVGTRGRGDNSDYQDLGLEVDGDDPTESLSPLFARGASEVMTLVRGACHCEVII